MAAAASFTPTRPPWCQKKILAAAASLTSSLPDPAELRAGLPASLPAPLALSQRPFAGAGVELDAPTAPTNPQLRKSQFVRFADVFPLKEFGFAPEPGRYLEVVGWVEVVTGLLLAFGPQLLQEISNFILSVIMIGAIYTLLVLREPLAMCAPATLCLGLLLLLNIRGHADPPKPKFE
ncbi:PREDICTED: uncharacterized protein ZMYM6NB [Haliaeetus leucocephalus]|uniref:uncharacterized protein ZMYM6NB n=1 Tax=Haliaeetus leucocephalus TaxID=52644 RepID=UPI00053CDBBF|nr:PREDICTED: uncharacterized protein ZMYM6NB [Haliaeetus leucocephalus]